MDLRQTAAQLDEIASGLRREAARRLRREGKTFRQIAEELGVSTARAHQLVGKPKRRAS